MIDVDDKIRTTFEDTIGTKLEGLTDEQKSQIAKMVGSRLGYSTGTVQRWFANESMPHNVIHDKLFQTIEVVIRELVE